MRILYLIPARKGSKGLPGKNTKILGNRPLVEYSIKSALENIKVEDELCISTNDLEVVDIAKSNRVSVPFIRPEELSSDTTSTYEVILHALNFYERLGIYFDTVLLLQPTSPFRNQSDFNSLINEYDNDTDMVVSVKLAKENPYFTLFEEDEAGLLKKSKNGRFVRRQDCPVIYAFNGSMYLINTNSIKHSTLDGFKKIKKIVMPEERSVDIDTLADWALAEFYLKNNENS
jgi:CMP-N,N'-diacetyllegionaminic acid synthase